MTPEVKTRTSACSRPRRSAFPGLLPRRWLLPVRLGHSCHQLQLQGSLGREAQSFPGCMRAAFSLIYSQDGRKQRKGKHTAGASTSAPPPTTPGSPIFGGFVVSGAQQTEEEGYVKVNGIQESLWGAFSFGSNGFSDYQSLNQALRRGCLKVLGP